MLLSCILSYFSSIDISITDTKQRLQLLNLHNSRVMVQPFWRLWLFWRLLCTTVWSSPSSLPPLLLYVAIHFRLAGIEVASHVCLCGVVLITLQVASGFFRSMRCSTEHLPAAEQFIPRALGPCSCSAFPCKCNPRLQQCRPAAAPERTGRQTGSTRGGPAPWSPD